MKNILILSFKNIFDHKEKLKFGSLSHISVSKILGSFPIFHENRI